MSGGAYGPTHVERITAERVLVPEANALRFVLGVIASGGTVAISGPSVLAPPGSPRYSASLEASSGSIHADAYGPTLASVLEQLEASWREQCPSYPPTAHVLSVDGDRL